ncbi:MAG: mycofactocin biosynthesis peptidyl-dipeptidase MftE [Microcella sp.]|uniref:mycofactocin biosynthesis peptidyl-dipeptidase MftE n=1 Tax=Microcella sp. TaxID=1913979 RepID=UPI0024CBB54A|nr:mycofactocin biosynthesis peptidyl-dipeptidase MftE [Microcella sp.]UYN83124.1 MAG: mycofactocin biosynthesis peptidyl-dipeptidase MftE [Microcella sp.]
MTRLDEVAWPGIPNQPLMLVPLGSTEQHGPHLPFTVDAVVAEAVARSAGARLGAVVAPVLAYGSSGEHQQFAGTLSIGQDALRLLLVELVRSARTWAARVVLVNGHGGNTPVLSEVVPTLRAEGHDVAWIGLTVPSSSPSDAHAGRTETALMLHFAPERVGDFAEVEGATRALVELMPALRAGRLHEVAPNGVLGDPRGATAAEGAALLATLVDEAVRHIERGVTDGDGMLRAPQ